MDLDSHRGELVASRTLTDPSAWANSRVIEGDLAEVVKRERRDVAAVLTRYVRERR